MTVLNEEIRVIQVTMSHLKQAIPLECDSGKRLQMQKDYDELGEILQEKLDKCGDYK